VAQAAAEGASDGAYEIHIVSGLHPEWSYDFYLDMVRSTREAVPDHVIVQAFTAVEIEHMALIGEKSTREVLSDLKAAGLDALPGGGRRSSATAHAIAAWDKKTKSDVWLRIHGEAHELGIATNCTMLYGHIETHEERVDHLIRLREQQDRDRGLPRVHPARLPPRKHRTCRPAGYDRLRRPEDARDSAAHARQHPAHQGVLDHGRPEGRAARDVLRRRRHRRHRRRRAHHAHGRRDDS
jgi:2-iminoacetate synthase ThiH